MKRRLNRFRRSRAPVIENDVTSTAPEVILHHGKRVAKGITYVPQHGLIAVAPHTKSVYVFAESTPGNPVRVFSEHASNVLGLVHLADDILASVTEGGVLMTWRAGTGESLDQLKVSEDMCFSIAKASENEILVGTWKGEIIIVAHENGNNLAEKIRCSDERIGWIKDIGTYNGMFVAVGGSSIDVHRCSNGEKLHSIANEGGKFYRVVVSDDSIVLGRTDCIIHVHQIGAGCNLLRTIDLREFYPLIPDTTNIEDMSFLNVDIVMVTTDDDGIFFLSTSSGQCFYHWRIETSKRLLRASVLSGGRVCVGGIEGYCAIFKAPLEIDDCVNQYSQRTRSPVLSLIPFFSPPLKPTFDGMQDGSISIENALELATDSRFSSCSIHEWTHAHFIVMAAVRDGAVPRDRKYKNDEVYWWDNLYDKAASLEMGEGDMNLVLKLIKEAESTGIIAVGCAELFKKAHDLKKELKMDINSLSNTMVDLYCRQIALDEKVQDILHSQKVQQRVAIVNAILACIPLAGGVAGHVLSGGMAFMENVDGEAFAVGGLVESLLGIGKDWSSFITEPTVGRFLRAGNIVLEEEIWDGIPQVNRLAVEAAAEGLGLSIEELRARLVTSVQEDPSTYSTAISEEPDVGDKKRITGGDDYDGTVVVGATAESMGGFSTGPKLKTLGRRGGGARFNRVDEGEVSISMKEIWKNMQVLERRNKVQDDTIEEMQLEIKEDKEKVITQGEIIEVMKMKIESLESIIAGLTSRN